MNRERIKHRLRNDFQLAVVTLLATIALIGLTPFAILRGINGQWPLFGMDLLIQSGILAGVVYAWRSGNARTPSLALAYFIAVMAVVAAHLLGNSGRYWFYAAIVANFFLIDRRHALAIALAALLALYFEGAMPASGLEAASFCVAVIVCALLSYAFAYRTAMQRSQLEALAAKDSLTGIYNRRTLIDDLERVREIFRREGRGYAVLVLDVDEFKAVNDRHGHLAGDRVLIALARLIERNIRKGDRLYRFGGEEFVIVAPGAHEAGLRAMAEKLRNKVAEGLAAPGGQPVTVSIGGAILRPDESVADWFARADTALYVAKNSGRNRSVIDADDQRSQRTADQRH
jgi:diguanylate cyclase